MPENNNLTCEEASRRATLLHVDSTQVALDLSASGTTFKSTSTIRFKCTAAGASSFVDLTARKVHEVVLNGERLQPGKVFNGNRISLSGLAADNEVHVVADCDYTDKGNGLHRFVEKNPESGDLVYLHTQFEPFDAHRMYACFDQPDLKTEFELSVVAPTDWEVFSGSGAEGRAGQWHFPPTPRIPTYITAVVAGPYYVIRDSYDDRIPLGIYCRRSLSDHLDNYKGEIVEVTKQGFAFFERVFDYPYPFKKYDQLFVPGFNAGAMENAGCVTINESYLFPSGGATGADLERRAETILHEMAHMWFGDLVTMRWWDNLWLNEAFATYMAVLAQAEATRWRNAWTTFANSKKTRGYQQDQLPPPATHPIVANIPDTTAANLNLDRITYDKGASVLKQLVAYVDPNNFFDAIKIYFRRHEWGNTTLQDLLSALQETSPGRDLPAWSKQWLETAGVNTLRPSFEVDDGDTFTSFAVHQEAPAQHPTFRKHRVAIGLYDFIDSKLVRREGPRVHLDVEGESTEVPQLIGERRPDLVLVNDDDLTYAKIRLDERSLATLTNSIGEVGDSLPRALCWAAAWDMTRDAEIASRDYLTIVLNEIRGETDIAVVQIVLGQLKLALAQYADPTFRPIGLQRLADAAWVHMQEASGDSDPQLAWARTAWARTFADAATSDEDLLRLRGLLSGDLVVKGLNVDTALRWHLLLSLVTRGAAGGQDIVDELERKPTDEERPVPDDVKLLQARACLAAQPTVEAKANAWAKIADPEKAPSNEVQAAVLRGFQQPDQRTLLEPYVERYLAVTKDLWRTRKEESTEIAQRLIEGLFPRYVIHPATLATLNHFMDTEELDPGLHRLLIEGTDAMARALRARRRDAAAAG